MEKPFDLKTRWQQTHCRLCATFKEVAKAKTFSQLVSLLIAMLDELDAVNIAIEVRLGKREAKVKVIVVPKDNHRVVIVYTDRKQLTVGSFMEGLESWDDGIALKTLRDIFAEATKRIPCEETKN